MIDYEILNDCLDADEQEMLREAASIEAEAKADEEYQKRMADIKHRNEESTTTFDEL